MRPRSVPQAIAAACRIHPVNTGKKTHSFLVEGSADAIAVVLLWISKSLESVILDGKPIIGLEYSESGGWLWLHFPNEARSRSLTPRF